MVPVERLGAVSYSPTVVTVAVSLVQKFLKDYTILEKMAKTLFSVGSQVMWESSVMKKQMQLQNRHSPYLSLV